MGRCNGGPCACTPNDQPPTNPDDDDYPATLQDAARNEQIQLWADLDAAIRYAHEGGWSIGCANLTWRIKCLARHVGATNWADIDVTLLRSGTYERILNDAAIPYAPIDWDAVTRTETAIRGQAVVPTTTPDAAE